MKPALLWLIIVAFVVTSCSHYTCPTYAKKVTKKTKGNERQDDDKG